MAEIKTLKNYAFRRLLTALISVMFIVLLGWYRRQIQKTDKQLKEITAPLQEITNELLSSSGNNDDSLVRSTIMQRESMISWLDLTPTVNSEIRNYISNLYTVAWAFDAAKNALPAGNDRRYFFNRWTIALIQTNSLLSGDVMALYSGRQTIQEAIRYLSGASAGTLNRTRKTMSDHNLTVALASQVGVEVLICTKSYDAFADGWNNVLVLYSGLIESYRRQIRLIDGLTGSSTNQCLIQYSQSIANNIANANEQMPLINRLALISTLKKKAYNAEPLQCPIGVDLYDDILALREYEANAKLLTLQNSLLENAFATGSVEDITKACESAQNFSWQSNTDLNNLLDQLTGSTEQNSFTWQTTNTGSYEQLPADTQSSIDDIYQNNIQYIETMQKTQQDNSYRPLQRLQELFQEFYGDKGQFIK